MSLDRPWLKHQGPANTYLFTVPFSWNRLLSSYSITRICVFCHECGQLIAKHILNMYSHQHSWCRRSRDIFFMKALSIGLIVVTAGYFYDTFAYEICFYGIYFYGIYTYGIYFYRALKFMSINCTVVRNT
jgi:hypothetical protein